MSWSVADSIQSAYQKILEIHNSASFAVEKWYFGISHNGIHLSNVQVNFKSDTTCEMCCCSGLGFQFLFTHLVFCSYGLENSAAVHVTPIPNLSLPFACSVR